MAALPGDPLRALIARVRRGEDEAWPAFVDRFAPLLLHAARTVERDPDAAADAFVFTCRPPRAPSPSATPSSASWQQLWSASHRPRPAACVARRA